MATLAAARADNMYYPPEWRPEYGSVSKFQGSNGHNQYEKYGKIRFELPVHGWCLGCGRHIGRGTRFNATKDQAGTYYSTKIWQFSMKCPSCSTVMIIKTDPKNTDYEYVEGIRKKDMAFDPEEAETQRVQDSEVSNKLAADPLYRLEHEQADKRRAASRKTVLTRLTELADSHARDDYSSNARLRQGMRVRKRKEKEREEEATAKGLGIRLATPSPADALAARGVKYRSRHKGFRTGEKAKMAAITSESIFGSGKETGEQARRKAVLVKAARLGLKTRGMRLVNEGDGRGTDAKRRRSHVEGASSSRAPPTGKGGSGTATRTDSRKRQRHHSGSGAGGRGTAEYVVVDDDCAVVGDESGVLESVGGGGGIGDTNGGGELPKVRVAEAAQASRKKETGGVADKPRKKRRKAASSGAGAAVGDGGLAAIACLY